MPQYNRREKSEKSKSKPDDNYDSAFDELFENTNTERVDDHPNRYNRRQYVSKSKFSELGILLKKVYAKSNKDHNIIVSKLDDVDLSMRHLDTRMTNLDSRMTSLDSRMSGLYSRQKDMDSLLKKIDTKLENMGSDLSELKQICKK